VDLPDLLSKEMSICRFPISRLPVETSLLLFTGLTDVQLQADQMVFGDPAPDLTAQTFFLPYASLKA
jgi:hypothetical protein